MIKKYQFLVLIPALLFGGCSDEEEKTEPAESSSERIINRQTDVIEQARKVEDALLQGAEQRKEALEELEKQM